MEPTFWHDRWQNRDIGFHLDAAHDLLQKYWARAEAPHGSDVFVPLCGKSLDMVWLASQGHQVIGAELSEIAVDDFFAERGLTPEIRTTGSFVVKSAGAYEIWCGDIFDLPHEAIANVAGVYDRASLVAFPAPMQEQYATKLKELVPAGVPMLLITLDYDQSEMSGPPFATPHGQVDHLFGDRYDMRELERRQALDTHPHFVKRGLTGLQESAYVFRQR